jgi:hypothetical protein
MFSLLRHFLASLEYRCTKAIEDAPSLYPALSLGHGVRTPHEILIHMNTVLRYALCVVTHSENVKLAEGTWEDEKQKFHFIIKSLDEALSSELPVQEDMAERLLQGPLSDAMTHVGQLSMLRRLAGSPIPAENFFKAKLPRRETR